MRRLVSSQIAGAVRISAAVATLLLAPGAAGAATAQSNESTPAAPTSPNSSQFVTGPHGKTLFRFDGPSPNSELKFEQIARSSTRGQVINTDKNFDLMRLPATFKAILDTGEICTATLIGPRVLLTAAHCVDTKFNDNGKWKTVTGSVSRADGTGRKRIRSCAMAPAYTASAPQPGSVRNENDFALCDLVDSYVGLSAETIGQAASAISAGQNLMLAGFGCTNSDLTNGAITRLTSTTGVLNVGFNAVQAIDTNGWVELEGMVETDAAILCPGDSGGAAYSGVNLNAPNDAGWRVAAINSAVGMGPSPNNPSYISYLAPLSDPDFQTFLTAWVNARPTLRRVCGVHLAAPAQNCRR